MLNRFSLLMAAILVVFLTGKDSRADELTFVGDVWPPYNMQPNSEFEGYVVDLLKAIFEPNGHTVKYEIIPWSRALVEVEKGTFEGIIGPFKDEAPGFIFPASAMGVSRLSFFVRKNDPWVFNGIDSLKGKFVGVIRGYGYRPWLNKYRESHPEQFTQLSGPDAVKRHILMLLKGRVDVLPENAMAISFHANLIGRLDEIRFAGNDTIGETKKQYVAFSPANKKSSIYAAQFDKGLQKLRENGKLKKILSRYGLKDWQ